MLYCIIISLFFIVMHSILHYHQLIIVGMYDETEVGRNLHVTDQDYWEYTSMPGDIHEGLAICNGIATGHYIN